MSGGRATVQSKKGLKASAQAGDISSTHWLGSYLTETFSLELKCYKDIGVTSGVTKRKGMLIDFWKQTVRDADDNSKLPLLVVKQDRHPALLCLSKQGCAKFTVSTYPLLIQLSSFHPADLPAFLVYDLTEFLAEVDAAVLEHTAPKRRIRLK